MKALLELCPDSLKVENLEPPPSTVGQYVLEDSTKPLAATNKLNDCMIHFD